MVQIHSGSEVIRMRFSHRVYFKTASVVLTAALFSGCTASVRTYPNTYQSPHQFSEGIYRADKHDLQGQESYRVRALVVAHHLVASESIALAVRTLALHPVDRIVLLSPDHYGRCPTHLCTTHGTFRTYFGDVHTNDAGTDAIAHSPVGAFEPELFKQEHGIFAVLPFIAHYLPKVTVVPVVLSQKTFWRADPAELQSLFQSLVDDHTALVVSSDFSHYLRLADAEKEDRKTMMTFLAHDLAGIRALKNPDQSDCPGCLWILANVAGSGGYFNPSILMHTNSAVLLGDRAVTQTTSHFAIAFYQNNTLTPADPAFAGDVTFSRTHTGAVDISPDAHRFWDGSGARIVNLEGPVASSCVTKQNPYLLCNLLDAVTQHAPLATHWGIVNNHMLDLGLAGVSRTVALLTHAGEMVVTSDATDIGELRIFAVTAFMNSVPDASKAMMGERYQSVIHALKQHSDARFSVVFVHGGDEYEPMIGEIDQAYLRSFIDAGADAVITAHSHTVSDMEIYHGKTIFHGLGNFLFDQRDQIATSTAKIVRLRKEDKTVLFETLTTR